MVHGVHLDVMGPGPMPMLTGSWVNITMKLSLLIRTHLEAQARLDLASKIGKKV